MRDLFYYEIRKCMEEIRDFEKDSASDSIAVSMESRKMLIDTVELLLDLSDTSRKEGLLALEERAFKMEAFPGSKYLQKMLMLVVDGTDPEHVQEIILARYFSSNNTGYEALQYLIMMYGVLGIQAGMNPRVLKESLENLLPEEIADEYERLNEEKAMTEKRATESDESDMSMVENLCGEDVISSIQPGDRYYYLVRLVDGLMPELDDRAVQRILRDVKNADLACAMKILGGKARSKIFHNLSQRLAVMIADDMVFMGPVRVRDAGEACRSILLILLKLIEQGEIVCEEDMIVREMATVFQDKEDGENRQTVHESENKLYRLWQEYLDSSNRRVQ